jgi:hypothetical protein
LFKVYPLPPPLEDPPERLDDDPDDDDPEEDDLEDPPEFMLPEEEDLDDPELNPPDDDPEEDDLDEDDSKPPPEREELLLLLDSLPPPEREELLLLLDSLPPPEREEGGVEVGFDGSVLSDCLGGVLLIGSLLPLMPSLSVLLVLSLEGGVLLVGSETPLSFPLVGGVRVPLSLLGGTSVLFFGDVLGLVLSVGSVLCVGSLRRVSCPGVLFLGSTFLLSPLYTLVLALGLVLLSGESESPVVRPVCEGFTPS